MPGRFAVSGERDEPTQARARRASRALGGDRPGTGRADGGARDRTAPLYGFHQRRGPAPQGAHGLQAADDERPLLDAAREKRRDLADGVARRQVGLRGRDLVERRMAEAAEAAAVGAG